MHKVALVGGPDIAKYTVADKLWSLLSEASGIDFTFAIHPITDEYEVQHFFDTFAAEKDFAGFNVALPWKKAFAKLAPDVTGATVTGIINTVFKRDGQILSDNTDVIGIERGFSPHTTLSKDASVLLIGAGGAGIAAARCLATKYSSQVFLFDKVDKRDELPDNSSIHWLPSLRELSGRTYDLIINASPLGKYYLNQPVDSFTSPLDLQLLRNISHKKTVLQEMNYMPLDSLLLQMAESLGLTTISGEYMLVYQAIASLQRYFDVNLGSEATGKVIGTMRDYISQQEDLVLCQRNVTTVAVPV